MEEITNEQIANATGFEVVEEPKTEEEQNIILDEFGQAAESDDEEDAGSEEETKDENKEEAPEEESKEEKNEEETVENKDEETKEDVQEDTPEASKEEEEEAVYIDDYVSEHTEGKFKNIEDLIAAANKEPETKEPEFASDRIKKLNELESKGIDITDVLKYEALGVSELDPTNVDDAIKLERLRLREEGFTESEIDVVINKEYNLDEEDLSEQDLAYNKVKLKSKAKETKAKLEAKAKELELPASDFEEKDKKNKEEQEQAEAQQKQWIEAYQNGVKDSLAEYNSEKFELGKENSFTFELDKDSKERVTHLMENPEVLWKSFQDEQGNTDYEALKQFATVVTNFRTLSKALFDHGVSVGSEKVLKDSKNPERRTQSSGTKNPVESYELQVAKNLGLGTK